MGFFGFGFSDNQGESPLHAAVYSGFDDGKLVALLLANTADVDAADHMGRTPLYLAANEWNHEGVSSLDHLIAAGATVDARNNRERTPLHRLSADTDIFQIHYVAEAVEALVAAGADVNARDHDGRTPLDSTDYASLIDLLVRHGGRSAAQLSEPDVRMN